MQVEIVVIDETGRRHRGVATLVLEDSGGARGKMQADVPSSGKERASLPDEIIALRDEGFFGEPKTVSDVQHALKGRYHCELERTRVALLRLQQRKELRKLATNIDGKLQVAYVW